MKRKMRSGVILLLLLAAMLLASGCGLIANEVKKKINETDMEALLSSVIEDNGFSLDEITGMQQDLPEGFPGAVPIYDGAAVKDSSTFGEDGYSVLYSVTADYADVLGYYVDALGLDDSAAGETEAYFEGIEVGDVFINGLTVTDTGSGTDVYITLRNYGAELEETDDYVGASGNPDVITYQTAQEVPLDKGYPKDVVPIYPEAKVIGCSIVPGTSSGFVDLLLPTDALDDAVSYYTDKLGLTPKGNETDVMRSVQFKGEIDGFQVVVLISHLKNGGNDPFVQITVNEK